MSLFIAFISGILLAIGITVSGMIDPAKVLSFLDLSGNWDPSLALVMVGALSVYVSGFAIIKRNKAPLFASDFHLPATKKIDRPLLIGALIFGIGWGLIGYCPGPAIAALSTGSSGTIGFVATMIIGWFIARKVPLA